MWLVLASLLVSIHAPREGCDVLEVDLGDDRREFQFTHPGRGATTKGGHRSSHRGVSIHAPREGCDLRLGELPALDEVSIHAPREGCDIAASSVAEAQTTFQFTHPGRGATPV